MLKWAFILATLGVVDFLPAFGAAIYPFGNILILGFMGLAASAIYSYRLGDITPEFAAEQCFAACLIGHRSSRFYPRG